MFLGLILGRKPWFDPFRPHLSPPNIYIVGKLWILPFIWRWAIEIWSILQAVRILLTSWDRIMHSYLHSVISCFASESFLFFYKKKICREHFNDRYRVGSDLSSNLSTRQVISSWKTRMGIWMKMREEDNDGNVCYVGDNWRGANSDGTWPGRHWRAQVC